MNNYDYNNQAAQIKEWHDIIDKAREANPIKGAVPSGPATSVGDGFTNEDFGRELGYDIYIKRFACEAADSVEWVLEVGLDKLIAGALAHADEFWPEYAYGEY